MWEDEERYEKLEKLKKFFLEKLAEDPKDGTKFDLEVLGEIDKLKTRFGRKPQPKPGSAYNLPELAKARMGLRRKS